jgi:hypothetical protein
LIASRRYTDEFLLLGNDKQRLWELQAGIRERLMSIRLALDAQTESVPK